VRDRESPMAASSETRRIPVRVLTIVGWLDATIELPRKHSLLDWLEHQGSFVRLEHVAFHGSPRVIPAFTVQSGAIVLLTPRDPLLAQLDEPAAALRVEHEIACLTRQGVLRGRLVTLPSVRVSRWLLHHGGFIALHDAHLEGATGAAGERIALAFVNAQHVVGVTDDDAVLEPKRLSEAPGVAARGSARRAPARTSPPLRA
jgi:hypothetical protein